MDLKKLSSNDLAAELARRQKSTDKLMRKREKLAADISALDAELDALGVSGGKTPATPGRSGVPARSGGRSKRTLPKNDMSLPDAIAASVEVRAQITPKEAAEYVKANGYKTNSKTFGMQVANTLAKDARFKRIQRGVYERVK